MKFLEEHKFEKTGSGTLQDGKVFEQRMMSDIMQYLRSTGYGTTSSKTIYNQVSQNSNIIRIENYLIK